MTPIKYILVLESAVFAVDHANQKNWLCGCASEEDATNMALILGAHHKVPVKVLNLVSEKLLPAANHLMTPTPA